MHDLQRFRNAQDNGVYEQAMSELEAGRKASHWMWFIFPQLRGLGFSPTADYYAIKSLSEARAYQADPVLGPRLVQVCKILLKLPESDPAVVFGYPDDLKLRSCMTLFDHVSPNGIFAAVLEKYYAGQRDARSEEIIEKLDD